ncbi:hypothetical protein FA15DRAFT_696283 [Coprinopsis marcescibilis]|uniref:Uncharacterized protein n=1 Tax=Coprinopsis marcescibilis TaxID=230819 RepID=A0A5C3KN92_COPMA|nr:hypothetical protein FA15DRAFT_696283 [Coprinopsis marcescibilis]
MGPRTGPVLAIISGWGEGRGQHDSAHGSVHAVKPSQQYPIDLIGVHCNWKEKLILYEMNPYSDTKTSDILADYQAKGLSHANMQRTRTQTEHWSLKMRCLGAYYLHSNIPANIHIGPWISAHIEAGGAYYLHAVLCELQSSFNRKATTRSKLTHTPNLPEYTFPFAWLTLPFAAARRCTPAGNVKLRLPRPPNGGDGLGGGLACCFDQAYLRLPAPNIRGSEFRERRREGDRQMHLGHGTLDCSRGKGVRQRRLTEESRLYASRELEGPTWHLRNGAAGGLGLIGDIWKQICHSDHSCQWKPSPNGCRMCSSVESMDLFVSHNVNIVFPLGTLLSAKVHTVRNTSDLRRSSRRNRTISKARDLLRMLGAMETILAVLLKSKGSLGRCTRTIIALNVVKSCLCLLWAYAGSFFQIPLRNVFYVYSVNLNLRLPMGNPTSSIVSVFEVLEGTFAIACQLVLAFDTDSAGQVVRFVGLIAQPLSGFLTNLTPTSSQGLLKVNQRSDNRILLILQAVENLPRHVGANNYTKGQKSNHRVRASSANSMEFRSICLSLDHHLLELGDLARFSQVATLSSLTSTFTTLTSDNVVKYSNRTGSVSISDRLSEVSPRKLSGDSCLWNDSRHRTVFPYWRFDGRSQNIPVLVLLPDDKYKLLTLRSADLRNARA